jgi:hypothetical protein
VYPIEIESPMSSTRGNPATSFTDAKAGFAAAFFVAFALSSWPEAKTAGMMNKQNNSPKRDATTMMAHSIHEAQRPPEYDGGVQ